MKSLVVFFLVAAPMAAQEIPKAPPNLFFPEYQTPVFQIQPQTPASRLRVEALQEQVLNALKMRQTELRAQVGQPKVCAIPLLNFAPKGNYTIKTIPAPTSVDPKIVVKPPAPACGELTR